MVTPEQLPSAIRLNATSRHLAILLGPAVGGGLMLLLGPAFGLLTNVLLFVPFTIFLLRVPYTGHAVHGGPRRTHRFGYTDALNVFGQARADRRLWTMITLAAATSFFVGNAFQAQMPEYAHHLGADEAGAWYSILLAGNAAGAILGALLLETAGIMRPNVTAAIVCAGLWAVSIGLFPMAQDYTIAVALLVLAGMFNIAFTSMAQTLVQTLSPPRLRGALVGLFNTAMLGLRFGSGITVGVVGAWIGVQRSLELSALVVAAIAAAVLIRDLRSPARPP
jgi:predicted MFS family arabinose efflux permease